MVCVFALGSNSGGQLATGDTEDQHHPTVCMFAANDTPEEDNTGTWTVCGGGNHTFLWSSDGRQLYGCGTNGDGELALGEGSALRWTRVELPDGCGVAVRKVVCGWSHTLMLTRDGRVYAAGSGSFGQLGTSDLLSTRRKHEAGGWAQLVGTEEVGFTDIACGLRHSLMLAVDGSVYACGANRKGQLGHVAMEARVPSLVCVSRGLPPIAMVACGRAHSILVAADRMTVFAAGDDRYAQCGPASDPQPETCAWRSFRLPRRARKVCAGWEFGAVLMDPLSMDDSRRGGGSVAMWGRADHGQMGINVDPPASCTRDLVELPLEDVVDLACGSNHAVAVTRAGEVYAWGWNEHGNVGDASLRDVDRPRRIVFAGAEDTQASAIGCGYGNTFVIR